jgi:predicted nucleic acid-binding Zn ribbon protein
MFCDGCGAAVQTDQQFCSKCGKQILGGVPYERSVQGRVQRHSHLLAILWLAGSALEAVGGLILLVLGNALFPRLHQMGAPPEMPVSFFVVLFTTLGIVVLAKAVVGFIGGWGLLQRDPWARVLLLVLAFISLIHPPFGTALGVYTLWVLLPGTSQHEYDTLVAAREAHAAA